MNDINQISENDNIRFLSQASKAKPLESQIKYLTLVIFIIYHRFIYFSSNSTLKLLKMRVCLKKIIN